MPSENVRELAEEAIKRLAADLEAGRSETLQNYLAAAGRFHRYSWGNVLLINAQKPDATRVAGFHAWRQLERSVKKGEKGIMIFAPVLVKDRRPDADRGEIKTDDALRLSGFRTAYVFDVEQTQGRPLPEFARTAGDPKDFGEKLKAIVAKHGISLEYDPSIAPAQGVSSGGRIRLVPDLSPAEEFSVLAHELAHEMLHRGPDSSQLSKVVRETQAEAVAFVVSRGIGLETGTAAADYIALYNGDTQTLADSLAAIQDASSKILKDLLHEEKERLAPAPARTSADVQGGDALKDHAQSKETDAVPERSRAGPDPSDSVALDR